MAHRANTHKRHLLTLIMLVMLAGCASPAPVSPPTANPEASITVNDGVYSNAHFAARLPDGFPVAWRVITSPAEEADPFVTIASDDSCAILVLSLRQLDAPPASAACTDQDQQTFADTVTLSNDITVYLAGRAPSAEWDAFMRTFQAVAESLAPPST